MALFAPSPPPPATNPNLHAPDPKEACGVEVRLLLLSFVRARAAILPAPTLRTYLFLVPPYVSLQSGIDSHLLDIGYVTFRSNYDVAIRKANCHIARAPSGKFVTKILRKPKKLHPSHAAKKLKQDQQDIANGGAQGGGLVAYGQDYDFKTCLVDPPRAGSSLTSPSVRLLVVSGHGPTCYVSDVLMVGDRLQSVDAAQR